MKYNFNKLSYAVDEYAKKNLTKSRYEHSVRVAQYAKYLSKLYVDEKVKPQIAYFAGLSHDICKQCSDNDLLNLVKYDGRGLDKIEKTKLNLLHGRAAAVVLQNKFDIQDESILNSIIYHTFGHKAIDSLGKMVYIADKIEPGRPNTQKFRDFVKKNTLDDVMFKILSWNIDYVKKKGATVHPFTKQMYKKIKENLNAN